MEVCNQLADWPRTQHRRFHPYE